VNAVDPEIASKIYSWVRYGKKVYRAEKGADILFGNQMETVRTPGKRESWSADISI